MIQIISSSIVFFTITTFLLLGVLFYKFKTWKAYNDALSLEASRAELNEDKLVNLQQKIKYNL